MASQRTVVLMQDPPWFLSSLGPARRFTDNGLLPGQGAETHICADPSNSAGSFLGRPFRCPDLSKFSGASYRCNGNGCDPISRHEIHFNRASVGFSGGCNGGYSPFVIGLATTLAIVGG